MHALARRAIHLAHVNEVEDDALRQAGPHPVRWSRELDGHEADRHERLAGGAAGLCRQPQPGPSALGESVRPPEQPPAVAEAAVLGGPHHKLRRGRPEREGREDVALAIGDHRDPRRLGPDLRRPPGAVEEGRRRRFEALLQSERIMLLEVVRLAHQAPDHRGDDAGGGREHEGGGRVAGAQEQGVEADQAGQDQDKLHRFLLAAMLKKRPGTAQRRFGGAPARGHAGGSASVVPKGSGVF